MADEPKVEAPLIELSMNQLKDKAVELGLQQAAVKSFSNKASLIATIEALQGKKSEKKIDPDSSARLSPREQRETESGWRTKRERMREHLAKQPTVRILIPIEGKEKPGVIRKVMVGGREEWEQVSGAIKTVTLNGFKTLIPKGRYWEVPQQVAEVIAEGQQMTLEAGKSFDIERDDPKTGKPVADKLS